MGAMYQAQFLVLIVLNAFFLAKADSPANQPVNIPAVVGYLPEWRYEGANWETMAETVTHLILFSLEINRAGHITAKDRIPRKGLLDQARAARDKHGRKLLICFGGNGRSSGFAPMVADKEKRKIFLKELKKLIAKEKLDGVDYNWEYPGYQFGSGYDKAQTETDYKGFYKLLKATRKALGKDKVITMSYYPDKIQEGWLKHESVIENVDLFHAMCYDQQGKHSTLDFAKQVIQQSIDLWPPHVLSKVTLGVPFYSRNVKTGDWTTYEDLVQRAFQGKSGVWPLEPDVDQIGDDYFNGINTIKEKTRLALEAGLGGVMIWEAGQDCRRVPVTHGETTHVATCPVPEVSLLLAIHQVVQDYQPAASIEHTEL